MNKIINHIKTINRHKVEVFKCMRDCGKPIQGLFHDMSKYSPTEFFESIKYWTGTRSPIELAKEKQGYSLAWFHHRGRNKHHSQYWCDISFGEVIPCEIPWKYLLELICDGVAAGRVYDGENWTCKTPLEYYKNRDSKSFYHINTRKKLEFYYQYIAINGWENFAHRVKYEGDFYESTLN